MAMGLKVKTPKNIIGGIYLTSGKCSMGILAHTFQKGERWLFLIRINKHAFGYRMVGDDKDSDDIGMYWPWLPRMCSGRR
jgi:hypothetical protein